MKKIIALGVFTLISGLSIQARSFRVAQLPNGSVFSCKNCHTSMSGGSRNSFGAVVESSFLDNQGNVIWNATLAGLDSDGDGFTNGAELQDPNGTWTTGSSAPGTASKVSNPGVKSSVPTSVIDEISNYYFSVNAIKTNLIDKSIQIDYTLISAGALSVAIYDINGNIIKNLLNENKYPGDYSLVWNSTDNTNKLIASGVYFINFSLNGKNLVKKLNIIN